MKGLPGTRVTGGFLVRTHNDDNVMQLYEKNWRKGRVCPIVNDTRRHYTMK